MKKNKIGYSLIFLLILLGQGNAGAAEAKKKNVKYTKSQDVSFEDQEIQGTLRTPDGAFVNPQRGSKYAPLYKIDQQFEKEIKDSVEYLN